MIAYCGLECTSCEAFLATAANDDDLRAKVAKEWAETYNAPIAPEHINCTGCHSTGAKIHYCEHLCEIRKCARGRGVATCAKCRDFPCHRLEEVFKMAPNARETLTSLKSR